jgi:DNA repair protein RecO (recombination protein O)
MKTGKDKIIILKVSKYSDSHLIINGINIHGAKISALAPAALKSKKRFGGGVLEPTHFIEIQLQPPKSEGMFSVLKEAQIIESFEGLRKDYDRLFLSFYFLKLIDLVVQEDGQDASLFSLLGHGLKALEKAPDLQAFKKHFEIKFLHTQGLLELGGDLSGILKKKFSEYISFPIQYEDSLDYLKLKSSLEDYVGRIDLASN